MSEMNIESLKKELEQLQLMALDDCHIGESYISRRIEKIESILDSVE